MTVAASPAVIPAGSDCTAAFRAAYENRYTWEPGFAGYKGLCVWEQAGTGDEAGLLAARVKQPLSLWVLWPKR